MKQLQIDRNINFNRAFGRYKQKTNISRYK